MDVSIVNLCCLSDKATVTFVSPFDFAFFNRDLRKLAHEVIDLGSCNLLQSEV